LARPPGAADAVGERELPVLNPDMEAVAAEGEDARLVRYEARIV
jgi:hypothetical protein